MNESTEITTAARRLQRTLHGALHLPGDSAYDAQRQPFDPAIDPRPAMYVGHAAQAERLLAPLRAVAGPALLDQMRPTTFGAADMGGTAPRHLDLLDGLPDAVIDTLVGVEEATVEVRHWGGAMARPAAAAGPVGHRGVPLSVIVDADVPDVAAALARHATGGSFLNFLRDPSKTERAYTAADYADLRAVKASYDPDNVFCLNHNIPPALPRAAASSASAAGAAR